MLQMIMFVPWLEHNLPPCLGANIMVGGSISAGVAEYVNTHLPLGLTWHDPMGPQINPRGVTCLGVALVNLSNP